jgi:hypothetical protein
MNPIKFGETFKDGNAELSLIVKVSTPVLTCISCSLGMTVRTKNL